MRKSVLFLVMALPLATLAPLTPLPAQAGLKLDIVVDGVSVREVRDWRADDPLPRRELRWRLDRLRKMAAFPLLKKKDRRHVSALISAYERRLAAPPPVSPAEQQARMLLQHWNGQDLRNTPQKRLEHVAGRIDVLLTRPDLRPRTRQGLVRLGKRVRAELDARASSLDMVRQREAERLLNRHINLRALPTERLQRLGLRVIRLLQGPGILRHTRQNLAALRDRIQAEMRRRTSTPAVSPDERAARNLLARHEGQNLRGLPVEGLRRIKTRITTLKRSRDLQQRTRQRLAKLDRRVTAELKRRQGGTHPPQTGAEREARQLLADARDLRPMTDAALRSVRWEVISLLSSPGLSPQTRRQLTLLRDRVSKELQTRAARRTAQKLLADRRHPTTLSDAELRQRLRAVRKALRMPGLPTHLAWRLRAMLRLDRDELRQRVARAENAAWADRINANVDALLADRRAPRDLDRRQLERRIRALRKALSLRAILRDRRRMLEARLAADRAELHRRLLRERQRRLARLRADRNRVRIGIAPSETPLVAAEEVTRDIIERQLAAAPRISPGRRFTIRELRRRPELREFMPAVDVNSIHFGFNEYWIREEEIDKLERIGLALERILASNPDEIFLIEGHTDAVGSEEYNQILSEKRAEAVKRALTEYFNIPAENLVTIGYGERFLKIPVPDAEPENRRVVIRRITPLVER